ncbi:hypothetical protein quinque_003480 [Culex quinquefasciatus]
MAQWFVPVLLLATLLVTSECVSKKRENQYEINVRHGPFEIHQRHVNTKPFKRTNPNDEGAMDQLGYRKEASLSEEVVTEPQPKKEPPRKHADNSGSKGSKVRGASVYRGQKKARHSWGYTANYGQSEFVTTTKRPQSFSKYGQRKKKTRRPHHSINLEDEDVEFKTLLSSERTQMEELAEKELMAGMKNFPFEKHIFPDDQFKAQKHLKNHNMDENYFQRTTKAPPESRYVTPTVLHNNPQLRVPSGKEKKGPVKFPAAAKTTQKPIAPPPVMTTQKPRKFRLPSAKESEEKDDKDEIYLLVKYEKPKPGGKAKANILEINDSDNELAKSAANRGRTRYTSDNVGPSSSELDDTLRNVKQNSVEVSTPSYSVSENLESGERVNQAPTPQPLLGTTAGQGVPNTGSGNIGPNQSGVAPGFPVQQDRLAQKYLQLQQNQQNQQLSTTQSSPVQQNVQIIQEDVTTASPQPVGPTHATPTNSWAQNAPPTLNQNFPSQPNLQSVWSQNQQSFQNIQNQLNQQNLQNQNLFFQTLQNQQTNLINRNRMAEALARQTRPTQPFFNQPSLPAFPNFPSAPSFPSQNLDFTGPMANPMIPPMSQQIYPQTYFNQPGPAFPHNSLNQHVFLGQSHNYMNSPQHLFTRSLMNSLSSANHLNPQAFLNQLGHSWNKPETLHKPLNFQSLSQDFDNLIAKTKESQNNKNSNQLNANSDQPSNQQTFFEQNQATTQAPPRSFQSFDFVNQNKVSNNERGNVRFNQENVQNQNQQSRPQTFFKQDDERTSQNNQNESPNFGNRNIELNAANSQANPDNAQNAQRQSQQDQTGPQLFPTDSQNSQNPQTSNNQQSQEEQSSAPNLPPNFLIPDHIRKIPPNQGMQQTVHQPDGLMVQHNAIRIQHQTQQQQAQPEATPELKLADQGDTRVQLDRSAKGSVEEPAGNSLQQDSRSSEQREYGGSSGLRDSYGDVVGEEFADFGEGARRPDTTSAEEEEEDSSLEELSETTDPLELSRMLVHRNGGLTVEQFNKLFRDYFDKDLTESDVQNLEEEAGTSGRSAGVDGNELASGSGGSGSVEVGGEAEGDLPGSFEADDQEQNIRVQINKAGARHEPIVKIGYGSSKSHQGVYKSPKFFEKLKESSVEDDWAPPEHLQEIAPSGVQDGGEFEQQEQSVSGEPEQQQQQGNSVSENPTNSGHQGGLSYIKFEKFN